MTEEYKQETLDNYFKHSLVYLYNNFNRKSKITNGKKSSGSEANNNKDIDNENITSDDYVLLYNNTKNDKFVENVLENEIENIIRILKEKIDSTLNKNTKMIYFYEFMLLFRLMLHTRDIENGKGEREYTYMMLNSIYKYYPELAVAGVEILLGVYEEESPYTDENNIPVVFGCWKDIQYLCNYIREHNGNNTEHSFINWCCFVMILQLEKDYKHVQEYETGGKHIRKNINLRLSLCAKWVPREHKKMDWLFKKLAKMWAFRYNHFIIKDDMTELSHPKAFHKCYMTFRKVVSDICKYLNINEQKMCSQQWSTIKPETINTQTLIRNKKAFMNYNTQKNIENEDRNLCSQNIKQYLYSFSKSSSIFNSKEILIAENTHKKIQRHSGRGKLTTNSCRLRNTPLSYFVKEGIRFLNRTTDEDISEHEIYLNRAWKKYLECFIEVSNYVPVLDITLDIYGNDNELYHSSIGMACLLCEKSTINKRIVIVNDNENMWINLKDCKDFTSILRTLMPYTNKLCFQYHDTGCFIQKIRNIFDSIMYVGMSDDSIETMGFFIIQNDGKMKMQHEKIRKMFIDKEWGLNIPMPQFVYWNMSKKEVDYENVDYTTNRVCVMSGYSPFLINNMSCMGLSNVCNLNAYDNIYNILIHSRYSIGERAFIDIMSNYLL